MSSINIYILGWFVIVVLLGCKTMFDQSRLVRQADPAGTKNSLSQVRFAFAKHPDNPELAALSKRVRNDLMTAYAVMIAGFLYFGFTVLHSK